MRNITQCRRKYRYCLLMVPDVRQRKYPEAASHLAKWLVACPSHIDPATGGSASVIDAAGAGAAAANERRFDRDPRRRRRHKSFYRQPILSNLQAELALERIIIERDMDVAETHRQNPTSDWQKDDCTAPPVNVSAGMPGLPCSGKVHQPGDWNRSNRKNRGSLNSHSIR
jgi:hypothetical protein